jgi:hypothetical protein
LREHKKTREWSRVSFEEKHKTAINAPLLFVGFIDNGRRLEIQPPGRRSLKAFF